MKLTQGTFSFLPDLSADQITTGTLDASVVSVTNLDAGNINTGLLDAGLIDAGTIGAHLIQLASGGIIRSANYVANTSGLWYSSDSGIAWSRVRQGEVYDVAIDASTLPSTVYLTDDGGALKSTNSGNSWINIHTVLLHSQNRLSVAKATPDQQGAALYLFGPQDPDHAAARRFPGT